MTLCPCDSGKEYTACCGPLISGERPAETAEAVMRSRYSAFATGEIGYLRESLHPDHREDHDPDAARRWAEDSDWIRLEVVSKDGGGADDNEGTVEFIAHYRHDDVDLAHHEMAEFARHHGRWYYVDGRIVTPEPVRLAGPKIGRNDPCPCGSGKKYKKCCG